MLGHYSLTFAPGIVARLRIVFISIVLVLCGASVVGLLLLHAFGRSADQLTLHSIPVFVAAEDTERSLKNLLVLLQRIDSSDRLADLAPLKESVAEGISVLRENTGRFDRRGPSADVVRQLVYALDITESGAARVLDVKREILLYEKNLSEKLQVLESIRGRMQLLLENLSYDSKTSSGETLLSLQNQSAETRSEVAQTYHQSIVLANALTSITLDFEFIVDAAIGLQNTAGIEDVKRVEGVLRYKSRSIAPQIGLLQKSASRKELANEIVRTRGNLFDEDGVLELVKKLHLGRATLEKHKLSQFSSVEEVSALSEQLTDVAKAQIDGARLRLTRATLRIGIVITLSMLFTLSVTGWALFFIVEKQISRRMARLTNAVLALAEGDTSYDVNVSGPDELGKIARALEVFEMNAQELKRSNTELEKFAYVAAHDLRSPLRAIQDLTEWTLEDTDNVFSSDGRENMTLLQQRIQRLNQLLTDLLAYSRVGKESEDLAQVSLKVIVSETADLLDPSDRFQISFSGPCDIVETYATPLRQILHNLINNSIKHHDRTSGRIKVEAFLNSGRVFLTVEDDGPGIPPKYHEKIFGLFQTLRPRDDVEGSGLGLAIIHKLLEHYHGSIAVQSEPEQRRGTTFVFDMPEESEASTAVDQAA